MTLSEFKTTLSAKMTTYNVPVYHAMAAPEEGCPVCVWQETGARHTAGDDIVIANVVSIQIDLYISQEYSAVPGNLENALNSMPVIWYMESTTYDEDRDEWDYIYSVQFLGGR